MADVADHGAGRPVEVAFAVGIPHMDPRRTLEHRATQSGLVEQVRGLTGFGHCFGVAIEARGRAGQIIAELFPGSTAQ